MVPHADLTRSRTASVPPPCWPRTMTFSVAFGCAGDWFFRGGGTMPEFATAGAPNTHASAMTSTAVAFVDVRVTSTCWTLLDSYEPSTTAAAVSRLRTVGRAGERHIPRRRDL